MAVASAKDGRKPRLHLNWHRRGRHANAAEAAYIYIYIYSVTFTRNGARRTCREHRGISVELITMSVFDHVTSERHHHMAKLCCRSLAAATARANLWLTRHGVVALYEQYQCGVIVTSKSLQREPQA